MSKYLYILFLSTLLLSGTLTAQERPTSAPPKAREFKGGHVTGYEVIEGDTLSTVSIAPVPFFGRKKDLRRYEKLVRNVKKVYPYAQDARQYLDYLESQLPNLKTEREREKFTKQVEKEIIKKYTPVLENMTYSQGKVLIKLIDRETEKTSYQLLKDFRGGFSAGFWNTIAKLFKADLKEGYDAEGEDQLIEQIIIYYEAGLL